MASERRPRRGLTLAATSLGSALAFIDTTIVVVALPTMSRSLNLGLRGQQWVYLGYALSLAALYLVSGALGDRLGLRRTFVVGVVLFALASGLCALAPNEGVLVGARLLQGIGGALLTTNSLALLRVAYEGDAGRAIGLWTSFTSLAAVIGPPAGGAIVEWLSWRWIFVVNLPLAAIAIALALAGAGDELQTTERRPMDVTGAILAAVGLAALTYALVEGGSRGLAAVWPAAVLAALVLPAFVVWTIKVKTPLVPLFRHRNVAAANVVTFLLYAALGGFLLFVPLYLQFLGYSPFEAGLALTPVSLVLAALAPRFVGLADRLGPRRFLVGGSTLIGAGIGLLLLVGSRGAVWAAGVPGLAVFSLGLAMFVAPITATAIGSAPMDLAGVASGVNQTVARVGGLVAVAVIGLVVTVIFDRSKAAAGHSALDPDAVGSTLRHASVAAFRAGMAVAVGLAFAGAAAAGVWIRDGETEMGTD
jgi:EmrB/QacA subfamily drug resistance transporter